MVAMADMLPMVAIGSEWDSMLDLGSIHWRLAMAVRRGRRGVYFFALPSISNGPEESPAEQPNPSLNYWLPCWSRTSWRLNTELSRHQASD